MKLEQQKQKMERQTQKAEQARQGNIRVEHQTQLQQQRQTRKMEQFQVAEEQKHHREAEWTTEPPLPPPPPQRTTSQQQHPSPPRAAAAAGHEATPPLPPPPEPEQLGSRVEQWVRQTSTERLVSTAVAEDKELEKLALDIAETVVENMERGSGSSKATKEEFQEVSNT